MEKNIRSNLINFSWISQWNVACNAFVPFHQSNSLLDLSLFLSISEELFVFGNWNWGMKKISLFQLLICLFNFLYSSLYSYLSKRRIKKIEKLKFKIYHHFCTIVSSFQNDTNFSINYFILLRGYAYNIYSKLIWIKVQLFGIMFNK